MWSRVSHTLCIHPTYTHLACGLYAISLVDHTIWYLLLHHCCLPVDCNTVSFSSSLSLRYRQAKLHPLNMASQIKTLRSSIIDGIAVTPRYRERQLTALHKALSEARPQLIQSLSQSFGFTASEALAEFLLTLNAIKTFHSTCDPKTSNEEEYTIAESKDHPNRRAPFGYAYITSGKGSALYGTVVPIAAAIASGNVVVLQKLSAPTTLSETLEGILSKALSTETFAVVERDPFDPKLQQSRGVTFDGSSGSNSVSSSRRICCPNGRTAAIVDRSGDVKVAARDLVQARFAFGGLSSYAPDVVLVNDFKIREFSEAVAEAGLKFLVQGVNGPAEKSENPPVLTEDYGNQATTLMAGDRGKVVLLKSRNSQILAQKVKTPTLILVSISSMDDAIDLLNSQEGPLIANYVYASAPAAKYITQFVKASASFVNHVPKALLVGGPAPNAFITSTHPRYSLDMFSVPSPTLIQSDSHSQAVASLISASGPNKTRVLEAAFDATLVPIKEPFGPKIGFFEQGFLFNASVILSTLVAGTVCGVKYGYPALVAALHR